MDYLDQDVRMYTHAEVKAIVALREPKWYHAKREFYDTILDRQSRVKMSDYKEYLDKKSQDPTYAHTFDLPSIVMPDNGNSMDAEHMKSIGYKYRIESQHVERDHPTAWWWRDMKLFDRVKERIEGKGFAFTSNIQTL